MGVRSRLASGFTSLAKVFGNAEPAAMRQGEIASQMTPATPFSPGEPIGPYDGFSRNPRTREFVPGYNIAARPRSHERVSFGTLRGLVESYDIASMCIWHRIDSIRALDWSLISAEGYGDDVTDVIPIGMAALKKPDRDTPFEGWLASYLWDILAYDAGTLYRMRNRAGRAIGLRVVDGTGIAPLLDYWGNTPQDPAEAYVQYVQGLPWNWLTRSDLIYSPFRRRANSPYGMAPLETILLNANTDLRFQAYFLQRFTEGNVPAAFASAPESWTPNQIEQFQQYWDAFMLGDQAVKSQIKWMPGGAGAGIQWSNEKDFSDHFSLFLMRKTCAAYHTVPADLGFTENVNRSSGESQADVQHRVGDLPLIKHVQGVLTGFLQDDLGLPLRFAFDLGEEQADRREQAEADKIYVEMGAISPSDVREMRYGLPEPDGQPVPRFIFTSRAGPIPLASLLSVSGQVDPATAAPEPGTHLPEMVFGGAEGVAPVPPVKTVPLAEQIYGPDAVPPAPPPQPVAQFDENGHLVKEGAPTEGVTSDTGLTSYDLIRGDEDEDEQPQQQAELVKRELAAFRRFKTARRRAGRWRDFEFTAIDADLAQELNEAGRLLVAKAGGGDPKGGDAPKEWPAWHIDQHLAAQFARDISQAVGRVLDRQTARRIATGWLNAPVHGQPAAWLQETEPALADQIHTALHTALTPLWTTAWAVGTTSAFAVMQGKQRVNWSRYTPGKVSKAQGDAPGPIVDPSLMVYDAQSLQDWLDHYGIDSISSISATRMDDLAGLLETALEAGDSVDSLSADIEALGVDASTADMIASTEVARAVSQASMASYEAAGVGQVRWLTAPGACVICAGNEDVGPIRLGDSFPSGADSSPAHPRCRCSVVPADSGGVDLPSIEDLKDILGGFE